jgi:hypothetical protein
MNVNTQNSFKLYSKLLCLSRYSRKYLLNNIPKVHTDLKVHLADELYLLTKNVFSATNNKGNIRVKYLTECQTNINMIDYLLTSIKELKCLNNRNINNTISVLADIKNIISLSVNYKLAVSKL